MVFGVNNESSGKVYAQWGANARGYGDDLKSVVSFVDQLSISIKLSDTVIFVDDNSDGKDGPNSGKVSQKQQAIAALQKAGVPAKLLAAVLKKLEEALKNGMSQFDLATVIELLKYKGLTLDQLKELNGKTNDELIIALLSKFGLAPVQFEKPVVAALRTFDPKTASKPAEIEGNLAFQKLQAVPAGELIGDAAVKIRESRIKLDELRVIARGEAARLQQETEVTAQLAKMRAGKPIEASKLAQPALDCLAQRLGADEKLISFQVNGKTDIALVRKQAENRWQLVTKIAGQEKSWVAAENGQLVVKTEGTWGDNYVDQKATLIADCAWIYLSRLGVDYKRYQEIAADGLVTRVEFTTTKFKLEGREVEGSDAAYNLISSGGDFKTTGDRAGISVEALERTFTRCFELVTGGLDAAQKVGVLVKYLTATGFVWVEPNKAAELLVSALPAGAKTYQAVLDGIIAPNKPTAEKVLTNLGIKDLATGVNFGVLKQFTATMSFLAQLPPEAVYGGAFTGYRIEMADKSVLSDPAKFVGWLRGGEKKDEAADPEGFNNFGKAGVGSSRDSRLRKTEAEMKLLRDARAQKNLALCIEIYTKKLVPKNDGYMHPEGLDVLFDAFLEAGQYGSALAIVKVLEEPETRAKLLIGSILTRKDAVTLEVIGQNRIIMRAALDIIKKSPGFNLQGERARREGVWQIERDKPLTPDVYINTVDRELMFDYSIIEVKLHDFVCKGYDALLDRIVWEKKSDIVTFTPEMQDRMGKLKTMAEKKVSEFPGLTEEQALQAKAQARFAYMEYAMLEAELAYRRNNVAGAPLLVGAAKQASISYWNFKRLEEKANQALARATEAGDQAAIQRNNALASYYIKMQFESIDRIGGLFWVDLAELRGGYETDGSRKYARTEKIAFEMGGYIPDGIMVNPYNPNADGNLKKGEPAPRSNFFYVTIGKVMDTMRALPRVNNSAADLADIKLLPPESAEGKPARPAAPPVSPAPAPAPAPLTREPAPAPARPAAHPAAPAATATRREPPRVPATSARPLSPTAKQAPKSAPKPGPKPVKEVAPPATKPAGKPIEE